MRVRRHCCLLLSVLLLLASWALQAQPAVLRVVGSADPPFRIFAEGGATGLYYDLMNEAVRRLGWRVSYAEVPSARAFKLMEQGEADLMLGPLRTPERELFLSYTRVVLPSEDKAFYTRPDAAPVRSLDDLGGRSIAVHRGKRYGRAFDADTRLQRQEVNDYRAALEMVARGRIDIAVAPEREGDLLLRETGLGLLKQPWLLAGEPPYVVLARASPWLARQAELERTFVAMREDGAWRRILERYGLRAGP
ncbi:transporter substrate-binding domain-containing protein [Paucibacter sp. PLA-PC-4]|uniref:substrate-binding periplasmic protein n=1 Tax=Paucibacter sp. PLA-PC-4 TaxID=2993655 RepID=UPI00224B0E61|nr:transporter substrate-binding domain-containing protein [Paucibacter sp. PLA-PC-4]MCX2864388.1 transporter substrate-binding domain-containing protein [Paucibacter sp. PLA-PC-4]